MKEEWQRLPPPAAAISSSSFNFSFFYSSFSSFSYSSTFYFSSFSFSSFLLHPNFSSPPIQPFPFLRNCLLTDLFSLLTHTFFLPTKKIQEALSYNFLRNVLVSKINIQDKIILFGGNTESCVDAKNRLLVFLFPTFPQLVLS